MDFKQYPCYKDSGVEWLGEVPEHWKILQTRHLFSFGKGLTITKENLSDEGIPCINYGEIHSKYGFEFNPSDNPLKCVSHDFIESNKNCLLNEGDFVFADTSEDLDGSGNFSYLNQESIVFAGYHSIIARLKNQKNNARFFAYLFDSQAYRNQVRTEMKGVKVFSVSQGVLKSRFAWLPPNEEQVKIISFLDSETSRIDNLIAKQEKLIEKLEEHRKSVISHAVTKGLDPNAKMKDSGVEWLGEVPETWKVTYLKYQTKKITSGKTPLGGATVYTDSGVTFLRSQNIYNDGLHLEDVSYIPDHIHQDMKGSEVYTNDILLNITGASIGRTCLVESEIGTANVNQHVCIIRPKYVYHAKWISMFLKANAAQSQISFYQNGAGREGLNFSQIGNIRLPLPSMEEQCQILESIEAKSLKIEKLISKQKELIAKLKSYRTSIISHAVTGKIDVRDLVA